MAAVRKWEMLAATKVNVQKECAAYGKLFFFSCFRCRRRLVSVTRFYILFQ